MKKTHAALAFIAAIAVATVSLGTPAQAAPPVEKKSSTLGPLAKPGSKSVDASTLVALLKEGTTDAQVKALVKKIAAQQPKAAVGLESLRSSVAEISVLAAYSSLVAEELVAANIFEAVDYNVKHSYHAFPEDPNDPEYGLDGSWGLKDGTGGAKFNIIWPLLDSSTKDVAPVAVIDTGFDFAHEDAQGGNIVNAWDFTDGDADNRPFSEEEWGLTASHGTATAGLIGADTNNGIGISGAAPETKVMMSKVMSEEWEIDTAAVVAAINDVVARGARVISMSFGSDVATSVERQALRRAYEAGVVAIASMGNVGYDLVNYPASYETVIAVGAINSDMEPTYFTTRSKYIDISAPGENIAVMRQNDRYDLWGGTSFSCPLVAAAAAIVLRANPALNPDQVKQILIDSAVDVVDGNASPGWDKYTGHGALDAQAALKLANATAQIKVDGTTSLTAGDQVSLQVQALNGDHIAVEGSLPSGLVFDNPAKPAKITGVVTKAGEIKFTLINVDASGKTLAKREITLDVKAGQIETLTVSAKAAIWNGGDAEIQIAGADKYGNAIPDVKEATTIDKACLSFTASAAKTKQDCAVTAEYKGAYGTKKASTTVEVFDKASFALKLEGTAQAGATVTAVAPAGWPVSVSWYRNNAAYSTGLALVLPADAEGDYFHAAAAFAYKGLSLSLETTSFYPNGAPVKVTAKAAATLKVKVAKKTVTATVTANGKKATGKVAFKLGKKTVTVKLAKGKATVKLSKFSAKKGTMSVTYKGSSTVAAKKKNVTIK
ncbi:MAG: S8 family serine peptidase [Propionibacteriaceae bacterium]|jgi:hypothetical protein|nr:S8 family serine peptidase [Propionibacteriaceae bacterium]